MPSLVPDSRDETEDAEAEKERSRRRDDLVPFPFS